MNDRGEPIDIAQVRHVIESQWSSGSAYHWAHRRLEVGKIIDVRWYVRLVDGVAHARAYETRQQAEQVAHQIMATPDRADQHHEWVERPARE